MTEPSKKTAEIAASPRASSTAGGKKAPGKLPPEVKKKRSHYKQKECPYCNMPVGNLPNHIRMKHADQAKAEGYQVEKPPASKEELLSGKKPGKEQTPFDPVQVYYCTACRARLRKGENPCWHCGETLNWEGVS